MLKPYTLSEYSQEYKPIWTCEMPEGCPPDDIKVPFQHIFFRLAQKHDTYCERDFLTYAEMYPERPWGDMLPMAMGLSLIDDETKARKNLKLPMFRNYKGIITLELNPQDGVVKQTGVHHSHYTWWRTKKFQIANLKMLIV
ncbi:MAG: hypothetical protein IJU36_03445 [Paludibacteraceae bacterium]|nr:hypothetical protein [Paludibacteraceae bacterium]